jgi:tetratricopeptide (TPR) repeat protein
MLEPVDDLQARLAAALAGRYTIEREIGRGGMSIVYQARDLRNDRWVALKVLRPELAEALGPERFLREIKVAAGLTHPHILPLFDSGVADGLLFYTMPYVEGESLRHRLVRQGRLSVADAVTIARDVADALFYAHGQNIVHRDIKPENILLEAGHPVVSDFGIARAISAANASRMTGTGIVVGTADYMSPEQASGEPLDGRSDIYSLAIVLHEMLAGELPRPTQSGAPHTLDRLRRDVSPAVARTIEHALASNPADRFESASDFAAALGKASGQWRWRNLAISAAVLAVVLVGTWTVWGRPGPKARAATAPDIASATRSPAALAHLLEAQKHFWLSDLDGAAAALRLAIEADSDFALAYHRLSVVETWRWDYPTALSVVEAGLRRAQHASPRWRGLLQAQRHYIMRSADSAIAEFQILATDYPNLIDAQLGLAEALYHYGGLAGATPFDAQWPFERVLRLDSTYAPIYHHLLALSVYRRDAARARALAARVLPGDRERPWTEVIVPLTLEGAQSRARTLQQLRSAERRVISLLVAHLGHAATDLPTVDTLGMILLEPSRPPADRERGAQYRFIALAARGHWTDAVSAWEPVAGQAPFDRWIVQAFFAGYPAKALADPMFRWAEARVAEGQSPDFTRPSSDDVQQAFQALVHRATLTGDSAVVQRLLRSLDRAAQRADLSDPLPSNLRSALLSRLALLRGDTAQTIRLLQRSVSRAAEPLGTFYPLLTMAPERLLLAEMLSAGGNRKVARQWLQSFKNVWSFGDVLYDHRVVCLLALDTLTASSAVPVRACSSQ